MKVATVLLMMVLRRQTCFSSTLIIPGPLEKYLDRSTTFVIWSPHSLVSSALEICLERPQKNSSTSYLAASGTPTTARYPTNCVVIQVPMLTVGRSISLMWLKNVALSAKAPRRVVLPKGIHLCTDIQSRAKRYERLLKGKGISPNGGPDPKPLPPIGSTRKVTKRKPKDNTVKTRIRRQKLVKLVEEEIFKSTAATEGNSCPAVPEASSPVRCLSIPISTSHEICLEMPPPNEEITFDFDDFCSPEMFAHCAPDTRQLAQGDQSAPISNLPLETAAVQAGHGLGAPPPPVLREELKRENKPERETVVIAD
jgi:hypothetical protein